MQPGHFPARWPHQVPLRARPRLPQSEVYSSEHPQELCRPPGLSLASRAPRKTQTSPSCQGRRMHPRGVAEVHVEHCPTARIVPRNAPMYGTHLLTQRCRENRNALSKAQVSNIPDNTFCKLESFPKSTFRKKTFRKKKRILILIKNKPRPARMLTNVA